ncbi:Uncharacterised protein [Shigella sonnei]|nr:Uncharacterised protein [Shigella sonnei]SRN42302.1 Uncharacterised protein [Shigella flexneri]
MQIAHKGQHMFNITIHWCNEFQQCFRKIGSNPFVRQCGT